jgi:hypothetical protein
LGPAATNDSRSISVLEWASSNEKQKISESEKGGVFGPFRVNLVKPEGLREHSVAHRHEIFERQRADGRLQSGKRHHCARLFTWLDPEDPGGSPKRKRGFFGRNTGIGGH